MMRGGVAVRTGASIFGDYIALMSEASCIDWEACVYIHSQLQLRVC